MIPPYINFREKLHNWLENAEGKTGRRLSILVSLLVIVSLFFLPFELIDSYKKYHTLLFSLETLIVLIFTLEYILRIYAAPKRMQYIFSFYGLIDLASILPFYLAFIDTRGLRAFRLARFIRIFKMGQIESTHRRKSDIQLLENEIIEHVIQKHPSLFYFRLTPIFLSILVGYILLYLTPPLYGIPLYLLTWIIAAMIFISAWFHYGHDVVYLTNFRIITSNRKIMGKESHELYYNDIVDIRTFHPNSMAYIMGFGCIIIETSAGTRAFEIQNMAKHDTIAHHIETRKKNIGNHR